LVIVPPPGRIEDGRIFLKVKGKTVDLLSQNEAILRKIRGEYISMIFQDPRSALNPVYTAGDQIVEVLLHHRRKKLIQNALERLNKEIETGKAGFLTKYYKEILQKMLKNPKAPDVQILSRIPIIKRYKRVLKDEAKKEAVNMLRIMKIPDPERVADMYPHELSGGMAQRVVIAMALACSPGILIADEPTTNLDVTVQLQILQLIKELKEKFASSVVYVTHDMGVIAEMCDRVAVMYAGSVVEFARVLDIFKKPLHPYTQGLLESIPRPGVQFKSIEGTVPSLINPPSGCRFHNRCHYAMDRCAKEKPRMVEVEKEHFVQCFLH
jgi:peptide/nickel transport system ATP-binding protein